MTYFIFILTIVAASGDDTRGYGRVMVFYATFNNISVISWRSVLMVDDTGVPGENHRPVPSTDEMILYSEDLCTFIT